MSITSDSILQHADIGVIAMDRRGRIQYANPQADTLLKVRIPTNVPLGTVDPIMSAKLTDILEDKDRPPTFHLQKPWGGMEVHVSAMDNDGTVCFLRSLQSLEDSAWGLPNIREMHLQFKTLLDHTYYGIYILDNQGIVLEVNDVAARLIGTTREKMIGTRIQALGEDGIVDRPLTPTILKTKKAKSQPIYVTSREKYLMACGTPVLDKNGEILFVVVIEHDMTIVKDLRKQLEDARQVADTIKDELSHRNLLELTSNDIIANSKAMNQVLTILLKLARMDASNILITGESGTGKGLLAKFIHQNGNRKDKPFISINCAALP